MLCMNDLHRMAQGPEGPNGEGWGRGVRKGVWDGGGGGIDGLSRKYSCAAHYMIISLTCHLVNFLTDN